MSTETLAAAPGRGLAWRRDLRAVRVVRLALAVTVAMAIAQGFAWPLGFVYVAVVVGLLAAPVPGPTLKYMLTGIGHAFTVFILAWVAVLLLLPFKLAFVLAYSLAVFLMAYHLHKGAPFMLILFIVLALILYPILGNVDEGLTAIVAGYLLFFCILALLTVQLAHGLLPDPPGSEPAAATGHRSGYSPAAARAALKITFVVVPAMVFFLFFDLSSHAVVMVYIGIMSLGGDLATGRYSASKTLIANIIGGLGALAFYFVVVAVPASHFFVVLTLATSLLFARKIFSGSPDAKYYGSALSGLVILVSQSLGAGAEVDANVIKRILFIILAGVYVVMAMGAAEGLVPAKE